MNTLAEIITNIFPVTCHDRIFLVGGSVRDMLLGRPNNDIDLLTTLSPHEIAACGFHPVTGKTTIPIWFRHSEAIGQIEATLIPDASALATDLARRDFTINAMAMTLGGDIIDPLNGRDDLNRHLLRACGPNTFMDDPLRIFRAFRFETDGWEMAPETEQLIRERDWSGAWGTIPIERFSREMLKALAGYRPEWFYQRMMKHRIGTSYLPELFRMPNIPAGPLSHHPEGDLLTHSLQVLQRVAARTGDPLTRFCALFHDLGKLATSPDLYPRHHGHEEAGFEMAAAFCQRLRLPAQYGTALARVCRLHGQFNTWKELRDSTKLRMADQAIKAGIVDCLPLVAAADKIGGGEPEEWRRVVSIAGMSTAQLDINLDKLEQIDTTNRTDFILQARILKLNQMA